MKIFFVFILCIVLHGMVNAQTKIAKEQIEDAFILNTGGNVYGDLVSATSTIKSSTFDLSKGSSIFYLATDEPQAGIRSNVDLYLDPTNNGTANAVIVPATLMEFPDFLGPKIHFFNHLYKIGVSAFDLDITSDRNIKFHSDGSEDLMVISGDDGDVSSKRDMTSGRDIISSGVFKFSSDSEGDKIRLFGTLYRMAVSALDLDFYSDENFKWHSDTKTDAMTLDATTGKLTLTGPLKLPIYTSLPVGNVGELIYFDHTSNDSLDGAYVYTSAGWQQL